MRHGLWVSTLVLMCGSAHVGAQDSRPAFQGMWSNPPATAVDTFCSRGCTDMGIAHLSALLDDAGNDTRPYAALANQAADYQREQYLRPRLTAAALETFPLDPAEDPSFLNCQPWGFARQIFAPHQMEIRQFDDRIDIRYGEWDARRTVYMDGRKRPENQPASLMGFSVGHYEGNTLVVETSGVAANLMIWMTNAWGFKHSDQLRAIEQYTRSKDGERLEVIVTIEDPWGLRQALQMKKAWGWAPTEKIFPYVDCEPPSEFRKRGSRP